MLTIENCANHKSAAVIGLTWRLKNCSTRRMSERSVELCSPPRLGLSVRNRRRQNHLPRLPHDRSGGRGWCSDCAASVPCVRNLPRRVSSRILCTHSCQENRHGRKVSCAYSHEGTVPTIRTRQGSVPNHLQASCMQLMIYPVAPSTSLSVK